LPRALVRSLQLEVANPLALLSRPSPRSNEAYDIYLRGLHAREQFDQRGEEEAVADFRRALELDPTFVAAAESLAVTLANIAFSGYVPPRTAWEQARVAAETILWPQPEVGACTRFARHRACPLRLGLVGRRPGVHRCHGAVAQSSVRLELCSQAAHGPGRLERGGGAGQRGEHARSARSRF
jgi:hypothetical protein